MSFLLPLWHQRLAPWFPALLLVGPLLLRLLPGHRSAPRSWSWRLDLPLLVASSVAMSLVCGLWLYRFHMPGGVLISSDFGEHCGSVAALLSGPAEAFSHNRSRLAALLPATLARLDGILDAFLLAGLLSMAITLAGLFLWARALHGRLAAVAAVSAAGAVAPMVLLSRHASFYPEAMATFTLGAGLCALAIRWSNPLTLALAGCGAGLCFLVDLRGLTFGLPFLAVAALSALRGPLPRLPLRLGLLLLPVGVAWFAGRLAYSEATLPLENQINLRQRFLDRGYDDPIFQQRPENDSAYVWGRSPPWEIPLTLRHLWQERSVRPSAWQLEQEIALPRHQQVEPWIPTTLVASLLALLGLRRRPWLLLALMATVLPFCVSLHGAVVYQRSVTRFLGTAMPFIPLCLGLAYASLAEGALERHDAATVAPWTWWQRVWWAAAGILPLLLVLGVFPSHLGPVAPWREFQKKPGGAEDILSYQQAARGSPAQDTLRLGCTSLFRDEARAGGPHLVGFFRPPPLQP